MRAQPNIKIPFVSLYGTQEFKTKILFIIIIIIYTKGDKGDERFSKEIKFNQIAFVGPYKIVEVSND